MRRGLAGLLGADRALLRAAAEAAPGTLWFIDRAGRVLTEPGEASRWLVSQLDRLPDPAGRVLTGALHQGVAARADAVFGPAEARQHLRLSYMPAAMGAIAGVLHVADRSRELALETQLQQAQRLQAVGELASGIAHDFNNLLTAILGAADDLGERVGGAELAQIRDSAERGAALVRQLLAFGRQQTLQPRIIPVNEAVRRAEALLRRLLGGGIELRLELEEPGRCVRVDPVQFDQILVNLAVNASHAMRQGGVLTITTGHRNVLRPTALGAETVPAGRYVSVDLRDTGPGIAPEILPRIFEPFFTTRRSQGGTGLGLSTVHGIVRQSEGFLGVESEPGQGACFRILLPRQESDAVPEPPKPVPTAPAARAPAAAGPLLLVEDEPPVRLLAQRALERAGWQVLACDCARDALARMADSDAPIAGVVSDVVMPGMNGPALVRALRISLPELPAVLVSGYADAQSREELAQQDIVFLAKPFAMRELVEAVELARQPGFTPDIEPADLVRGGGGVQS